MQAETKTFYYFLMSKLKFLIIGLMISSLFVGCTEDEEKLDITGISFDGTTLTVTEGISYDVAEYLTISGNDADQANLVFTSGDASILSVENTTLTAVKVGSTTLTATETNSELTATVNVEVIAKVVDVTGITLDKETADLKVGSTLQLTATIAPADATEQGVTWSVAFPTASKAKETVPTDIATVSDAGLVTAVAAGEVVVTATSKDGGFSASTTFTITNVAVESVTIDQETIDVVGNAEVQLTTTILPENATIKDVTWSLEYEPIIARISAAIDASYFAEINAETGVITGKQACDGCGLKVVATTVDGNKVAKQEVTITYVELTGIVLDPASTFEVLAGKTQQMSYTTVPADANNQTPDITWSITTKDNGTCSRIAAETFSAEAIAAVPDYSDYATIDENGLLTAVNNYLSECNDLAVNAYVVDLDQNFTSAFNVKVVEATSVTIDQGDEAITLELGASITLSATVVPEDTSFPNITWYNFDPRAARISLAALECDPTTVNSEGVVTASSNCTGSRFIYAYNSDSGLIDSIEINAVCTTCK